MDSFRVKDIIAYLSGLDRLFDIVRIVDPVKKKVIHCDDGENIIDGLDCYEFWCRGKFCDNCISTRAMIEKKTISKIEYNGDGVYMVMATPIIFGDDEYIVEMIKDITEMGIITDLNEKHTKKTEEIISELSQRLVTDELTGAYNRRFINEKLPNDIIYATKNNEKISVIMLDIDCFKDINDIYGHIAGDLVLKELTNIISNKIRNNYDWVARYGGDEFLIVLKNSDKEVAHKVIKEIQIAFKNIAIKYDINIINMTISFGVYTVEPGTKEFDEILFIVDNNLNKAKKSGKNIMISS